MKAIVLLAAVVLAVALAAKTDAAPAGGCAQVVQSVNSIAGTIAGGASSYRAHRENFVELTYGESRQTVANALQLAAQEKSQADPLKADLPDTLASFKAFIAAAQSQNCLPSAQLSDPPVFRAGLDLEVDRRTVVDADGR